MKNNVSKLIALVLVLACSLTAFCGCGDEEETSSEAGAVVKKDYTVTVKTLGNMPLESITVSVYLDENKDELVYAGETDENGEISFTEDSAKKYVAVLSEIPAGYLKLNRYIVVEETEIILKSKPIALGTVSGYSCKLGGIVPDISFKTPDGKEYILSEILEEKKAVVLNFWFIGCNPCKMEFPHMQRAYMKYSDKIEVLALNPYDGTDETVAKYARDMGLTFPVAACESTWMGLFGLSAFPATMVIDRYGMVAFAHIGSIPDQEVFEKIFAHFTADDYEQRVYKNLDDIISK